MQNNRNLHSSEISALYKIFKSQLPNSIILAGQDTDIISTIARNLASLIISTKHILNLKSNFKSFGIVFLSFLIFAFLSVSFVVSRMNSLPISAIS